VSDVAPSEKSKRGDGGLVVGEGIEDEAAFGELSGIREAGLVQESQNAGLGVVWHVFPRMKQTSPEATLLGAGSSEIEKMKGTAGTQDAADFPKCVLFLVGRKMVVHEGREHAIEGGLGVRQRIGEAAIELDREAVAIGLLFGAGEGFGIRIESHDGNIRMQALDEHDHGASAATDVEDAQAGA